MATRLTPPQPGAKKTNSGLMATIAVLGLILFLVPLAVGVYTDWLWFGDLGFRGVFSKVILTRVVLFVIFAALGGAVAYAAAMVAWHGRPTGGAEADPFSAASPYRSQIESGVRTLLVWVPLILSLIHI